MPHERRNRSSIFRDRARELRSEQNQVEAILWQQLRNGKLKGFKFRRQHPIGSYILDFYCAEATLVIELDGNTHRGREKYDSERQTWLESQGLMVIRCPNHEFWNNLDELLELVWRRCCERAGREGETRS
jgi:very-short-patch-repair endonuclease